MLASMATYSLGGEMGLGNCRLWRACCIIYREFRPGHCMASFSIQQVWQMDSSIRFRMMCWQILEQETCERLFSSAG